jgi:polyhydroxyalkanoate synthase
MPIDTFASTNKDTVWAKNKARLYHYHSRRRIKYRTPVLFAYALINRASLLDLMPGQSLVEHLLKEGYDVYLLDWGTPGLEDKEIGFGDLVFDYVDAAVKKVLQISGSTKPI